MVPYTKLKIVRVKDLTKDTFEVVLQNNGLKHRPGDCLLVRNLEGEERPYFVASGVGEPWIRLLIRNVESSTVASYLYGLKVGDMVKVNREVFSVLPQLINAEDGTNFIVSEIGVAPLLSYLSTFPKAKPNIYYLINNEGVNVEWLKANYNAKVYTSPYELITSVPIDKNAVYYIVGYDNVMVDVLDRLKKIKKPRKNQCIISRS